MGLFKNLSNAARGLQVGWGFEGGTKGLTQEDVERFFTGGTGDGPYKNFTKAQQLKIVANNSIVFSCITTLCRAFQEAPIEIEMRDKDNKWSSTDTHTLLEAWQNNPDLSESELKQYMCAHLNLCGQSFMWEWKSTDGITRELWPIPPSWVTINPMEKLSANPSDERIIRSYTIRPTGTQGEEWTILPEDMMYMRFIDPANLYNGLSPIQAASRYIQLEQKAEVYKGEAVSNLSLPGVAVKTRKAMNDRQKADLRAALRQKMGGDARQNAIMISGDEASIELLNPLKDFDWENYIDLDETRICSVFGVPPIVVGLKVGLENSPWSNTGEAKRWMYRNTVKGLWDMGDVGMTRALVPATERGHLRYNFNVENIAELQEDINDRNKRAIELFDSGVITRGRAKEMIGEEAAPNDEFYKYQINTMLLPATAAPPPTAVEPVSTEEHLEGAASTNLM